MLNEIRNIAELRDGKLRNTDHIIEMDRLLIFDLISKTFGIEPLIFDIYTHNLVSCNH